MTDLSRMTGNARLCLPHITDLEGTRQLTLLGLGLGLEEKEECCGEDGGGGGGGVDASK